ncbi:head-tail connector protein [Paucilactobacillus sp. N302-9]
MPVKVENLITELNLDDTDETHQTVSSLIDESQSFIISSVDSTKVPADFADNKMFDRAVKTMATQLFYDRTMANGTSLGLQMMINHLKGGVTSGTDTNSKN